MVGPCERKGRLQWNSTGFCSLPRLYGIIKTWRFTNRKVTDFLFWMRNHQLGHVDDVLEHRMHVTGRTVATFIIAAGIARDHDAVAGSPLLVYRGLRGHLLAGLHLAHDPRRDQLDLPGAGSDSACAPGQHSLSWSGGRNDC